MAAAKNETTKPDMVYIRLERAKRGQPNYQFVAVNGKTYKVKKGTSVLVPLAVAEVIANANRAADAADDYSEKAAGAYGESE